MVVEEREARNGCGCDLSSSMGPETEANDNGNGGLLLDSSGGGDGGSSNFGEGSSADGFRMYERRKRRKMSKPDGMETREFNDETNAGTSVPDQDGVGGSSSDGFPNGPCECSPRHCRKLVLQKMHQSLVGNKNGLRECIRNALITRPESVSASSVKEPAGGVGEALKQTQGSAKQQANGSGISTSTRRAFIDTLMSEKFSELIGLLVKNFGDVNVERILDFDAIDSRMKDGAYEAFPVLYHMDIQQVWKKLQQVGNEMVALAKSLSDISTTQFEQSFTKPKETEPEPGGYNCRGCGENANVRKSLVCDSCEDVYHVSCTDVAGGETPRNASWYCAVCVSKGHPPPHGDGCAVCEKLKPDGSQSQSQSQSQNECFVCKLEVKSGEGLMTCGHSECAHKRYHETCLTGRQRAARGPVWYCPSCLCRRCLVDRDDDRIVLCDGCDQAYHMYCMTPPRACVPKGSWFCVKCDRDLKRIRRAKRAYEEKEEEEEEEEGGGGGGGGLDMLVTAAKTLSHEEEAAAAAARNVP